MDHSHPLTPQAYQAKHPHRQPLRYNPDQSAFASAFGTIVIATSDLHLGVKNRQEIAGNKPALTDDHIVDLLKNMTKEADHLVLNGDSFELIYPKHDSKKDARKAYLAIISDLTESCAENNCRLHVVAGNHDDNTKFLKNVQKMADKQPDHLSLHPAILRIGSVLFTHGDLPLRANINHSTNIHVTERQTGHEKYMLESVQGAGKNQVRDPDQVHKLETHLNGKLHYWVQRVIDAKPQSKNITTILKNLQKAPELFAPIEREHETVPATTRISTGHTHVQYTGLSLPLKEQHNLSPNTPRNLQFDNTGTPLEADRFNALRYELSPSGVRKVTPIQAIIEDENITIDYGKNNSHHIS